MDQIHKLHYGWIILPVSTLVVFSALGLARFGYSIVLPSMQEGLALTNTHAGMLATANLVGYLCMSVIGGALASWFGPRIVITIGLALAAIGMFGTGLSDSFMAAAWWRLLTGIGSGASNVPVMGLISAWFGKKRRGFASGIAVAGSSVALICLGPAVPLILLAFPSGGWRVCWHLFGAATAVLAVCSLLFLRNRPSELGLAPLGDDRLSGKASSEAVALKNVYWSGTVWHTGLAYAAFGFSYIIYMTFFVKYLVSEAGYSRQASGNLFMLMGWFSLPCGLIWGSVSDRIGRKWALILVYLMQSLAFGLFALWHSAPGYTLSAMLFGITAWSIPAIMAALCGDILGPRLAPAALGFITLFFGIGQALAPGVAGALADRYGSFAPAFLLASGVALLGAVLSLPLRTVMARDGDLVK